MSGVFVTNNNINNGAKNTVEAQHSEQMADQLRSRIHIISDSRGADFQNILDHLDSNFAYTVSVNSGAGLSKLIDIASLHLQQFDLQIIVGGICDVTDKTGAYITFTKSNQRQERFRTIISDARDRMGRRTLFANVAPASLSKYNAFKLSILRKRKRSHITNPPTTATQGELEEEVQQINKIIEKDCEQHNLPVINLEQSLQWTTKKKTGRGKKTTKTIKKLSYGGLYDGLHADDSTKRSWCIKIKKAAQIAYNNLVLEASSQESSQEEDWSDFKRRRLDH